MVYRLWRVYRLSGLVDSVPYFVVAIPAIGVYPMRKNFKKEDIL
jgi:hypothetical protein